MKGRERNCDVGMRVVSGQDLKPEPSDDQCGTTRLEHFRL